MCTVVLSDRTPAGRVRGGVSFYDCRAAHILEPPSSMKTAQSADRSRATDVLHGSMKYTEQWRVRVHMYLSMFPSEDDANDDKNGGLFATLRKNASQGEEASSYDLTVKRSPTTT